MPTYMYFVLGTMIISMVSISLTDDMKKKVTYFGMATIYLLTMIIISLGGIYLKLK